MKPAKTPLTDRGTQKLLVVSVASAYLISLSMQLEFAITQYISNPNLSGFYISFLTLGLLPIILFAVPYLLIKRTIPALQRAFESVIIAVAGIAIFMALSGLTNYAFFMMRIPSGDMFGSFGLPTIITVATNAALLLYVLRLRRAGRW